MTAADALEPLLVDELRARLLGWYHERKRTLPWRDDPHPYRVWISEVMLQQTQVATVLPYFERWLDSFPDVHALAAASEDEVMSAWSGLGYYSRARNLQRAAQVIVAEHDGVLPADHGALLALPGIGPYTAGAIASIAFGIAAPIVDGNVTRVLARWFEVDGDPTRSATRNRIWALAEALVPDVAPGDFNQAMMELGALVCRPRTPACNRCVVASRCGAHLHGRVHELPSPKPKRKRHRIIEAGLLIRCGAGETIRYLLVRRSGTLLGGLWSVPTLRLLDIGGRARGTVEEPDVGSFLAPAIGESVRRLCRDLTGHTGADRPRPLPPIDHGFTHIEYTLVPWLVSLPEHALSSLEPVGDTAFDQHTLVTPADLADMGVPRMVERLFEQL